jgi:hypothetical protein
MTKEPTIDSTENDTAGFRVSDQPVISSNDRPESSGDLARARDKDLLCVIARDPSSLFVCWNLNWSRLFTQARISPRPIRLRVYGKESSVEGEHEINPFRGYCQVDVTAADTAYYCELGCYLNRRWKNLIRSNFATTPHHTLSEDVAATFATLPFHLSFERILDVLEAEHLENKPLASAVAELQSPETNREIEGLPESSDLKTLLTRSKQSPKIERSEKERAKWDQISRRIVASADLGDSSLSNG